MKRRVCVVTGSRADYGLLYWILHDLRTETSIDLQLVVTGMHLSPEFGLTVREIELDGFEIARRVEMLLSSDTPCGVAKSIGLGVMGMSDALEQLQPDVVLVLGDRFEILAAAQACLVHCVPLAHIAGGDTTEGAFDESIRHAVTKMAHVHFVTNPESARRVRQLGEDPNRVHVVGSPGLDHLRRRALLGRDELERALDARLGTRNLLLTFHPVTLEPDHGRSQLEALLTVLDDLPKDVVFWITGANADTGGREIAAILEAWVARNADRAYFHASLGQLRYLSLMSLVDAVVGNSSSGLYEAPSLGVASVDVGNRQRGRLAATSVIQCAPDPTKIRKALDSAMTLDCTGVVNPYGDGRTAGRVVGVLRDLPPAVELLKKRFYLNGDEHG
jgi:UDP-N-acetylglucosamine 2-epimerase (non-hydrolysing)/GDP/UDP-N,N'-diacetylbacillosamine 2-epimerase (hydrolysing)